MSNNTHAVPRARVFTAAELAQPCVAVEHGVFTAYQLQVQERLIARSIPEPNTGCLLWLGSVDHAGYGQTCYDRKSSRAHVASYRAFVGGVPAGLQLDHLCRVRCCINPRHLEPVTARENTMRGDTIVARYAARTHCPFGHEFTKRGRIRICLTCQKKRDRDRRGRTDLVAATRARTNSHRDRMRAEGRCIRDTVDPSHDRPSDGSTACHDCLDKTNASRKAKRASKWRTPCDVAGCEDA